MREFILKEENRKRIFAVAFILYLTELILCTSVYGKMEQLHQIFVLARLTSYILVCSKLLLDFLARTFSLKEIGIVGIISLFLLWIAYNSGNKAILIYWAFIVAAHDMEFEKIIKWSCLVHAGCLVFVIASSYGGIIENRLYDASGRARESLGFQFATESSNYFFYTLLMWIYWRKNKITWKELAGLSLLCLFLFYKTDTKSAFGLSCLALIIAVILKKVRWFREYHSGYMIAAVCCVPLLAYSIFRLSAEYSVRIQWMEKLNKLVTGRLRLGKSGIKTYGISLWGQRIEWIGGTAGYEGIQKAYNYVDSSFMQILLSMGIVFLLFLITVFVLLGLRTAMKKDTYLLAVLILIAIHSTFDPQIILMEFNSFIMLYSYFYWKGENSFYLKQLWGDLWRHKVFVGICMLAGALLFGTEGNRKITEIQNKNLLQQQMTVNYEENLASYDDQIEDIRRSMQLAKQQKDKLQSYVDNSVYMRFDGGHIYESSVRYQLDTQGNAGNILNNLVFYINEGGMCRDIQKQENIDIRYWREMVSCSIDGVTLRIAVTHYDRQDGQELLGAVKESLEEQIQLLSEAGEGAKLTVIEASMKTRTDTGVTDAQNNYRASVEGYAKNHEDFKNRLEGLENSRESYAEKEQPEAVSAVSSRVKFLAQYVIAGAIFGIVPLCAWFMGWYVWEEISLYNRRKAYGRLEKNLC